jgi:hypothetical protein
MPTVVVLCRYRVDDMLGTIGKKSVRDARAAGVCCVLRITNLFITLRVAALRLEMINSSRLKHHFAVRVCADDVS